MSDRAWEYVRECLASGRLGTRGEYIDRLEIEVARYVGRAHAVATVNGTSALHLALLLAGVSEGTEVLMSPLVYVAPANAVRYLGAFPTFTDVEEATAQWDPEVAEDFLKKSCRRVDHRFVNRNTGRTVSALLVAPILGHCARMHAFVELAQQMSLPLVEDASQALGASEHSFRAGAFGLVSCLSFNSNKLIATGGGGMLLTDDERLCRRARSLVTQARRKGMESIFEEVGYNARMTNLHAAVGCSQMEDIEALLRRKNEIAFRYASALEGSSLRRVREPAGTKSSHWLNAFVLENSPADSRPLIEALRDHGIEGGPLWQPLYRSPAHRLSSFGPCPVAEALWRRGLTLPSSPSLTDSQASRTVEKVLDLALTL